MLNIWGRPNALNVHKAVWAAEETGVPYQRIDAGRKWGVVDTPKFRKLNPNGLVPVIEDGEYVLWESNAIVRYLCGRYGENDLYPADFLTRIEAERWMDWQATELMPAHKEAYHFAVGGHFTPERFAVSFEKTNDLLAILDAVLADRAYVAGDHFTMGDIPIGLIARRWYSMKRPIPPMPNLERWFEAVTSRPGFAPVNTLMSQTY